MRERFHPGVLEKRLKRNVVYDGAGDFGPNLDEPTSNAVCVAIVQICVRFGKVSWLSVSR
jgi:hypothetical protein